MGCPPLTCTDFGEPLAPTATSSFTVPWIRILRAISGYCGATLLTTLRTLSDSWACKPAGNDSVMTMDSKAPSAPHRRMRDVIYTESKKNLTQPKDD